MSYRVAHAAALIVLVLTPTSATAQPAQNGYPNIDKRFEVAPGDTVLLLNRFVNEGGPAMRPPGRRLDLEISTRIPRSDSLSRLQQADRAAQYFGADAIDLGVRRLSIGICDTRACAERRDPPAEWYLYERTASGWRRSKP